MSKAEPGSVGEQSPRSGAREVEPAGRDQQLSRDDAFEMLSNRRRRYVLHYLQETGDTELSDLAEQVAAWENDSSVPELSASERKTVYTSLQQFHLPKMDDTGVVEFDRRDGAVELTEAASGLDIYLEVVDEYDIPWSVYYLGFSLVGLTMVGLSWLGVAPFAAIPYVGWTVFLLAALLVSSVSHFALSRRMRLGDGETPPEVDG